MPVFLISFIAATVLSAVATPFARMIAFRFNIVSTPGGRHIHGRVIPRLGGIGIYVSVVATGLGLWLSGKLPQLFDDHDERLAYGLVAGGTLMFLVGIIDDVKGMRAVHKLGFQVLAAAIGWQLGFRIDVISLPLLGDFSLGLLSLPATVFWVVGIINAVNLIDGLDGLAAGVVFFAGITNFVVASLMGTTFVAVVMATMAGAVMGFLFYNFNPARIFMGDSGSYFLGYILAVCSIAGPLQKASAAVSIAVPIVALGVPIIDTLLAMLRRFLERRPILSPDRGHIHHRLLDMGITHRRAVLIIYGVTIALCVGSVGIALGRSWQVGAAILGVSAVLFGLIRFIGYFEHLSSLAKQRQRIRSRHVEWLRKVILLLPARLDAARDESGVFESLRWLATEARLDSIELVKDTEATPQVLHQFRGDDYKDMELRDACTVAFPFGKSIPDLQMRFVWRSEHGDVSPQMDILLELVVNATEARLMAINSALCVVGAREAETVALAGRSASAIPS